MRQLIPAIPLLATPDVIPLQIEALKPAMEALGPYPILQFFAALTIVMVIGFGGILWIRGEKIARSDPKPLDAPRSQEGAVQLYFDGPLKAIFDVLHEIQTSQATNKLEYKDVLLNGLSNYKGSLFERLSQLENEIKNEYDLQKRTYDLRLTAIERQLQDMRDMLVRIETRGRARSA